MKRRLLPRIYDHNNRPGSYATEWEGWVSIARREVVVRKRVNRFWPSELDQKVEDAMGCYKLLHETHGSTYVLYVGYSEILRTEIKKRLNERKLLDRDDDTTVTVLYIPNKIHAMHYEDELIRYYAPPWNTKFHKQG